MDNFNIEVGEGSLLVKKGEDFDFNFSIQLLQNEISDTEKDTEKEKDMEKEKSQKEITQEYKMNLNNDMIEDEYKTAFAKRDWISVSNFKYNKFKHILYVTGVPSVRYKYKVELLNIDGNVLQLIKNFGDEYIYDNIEETVKVPISLITTSVNSYAIKVTVETSTQEKIEKTKEVILYNEKPLIIAKCNNNRLYLQINDEANDLIRYNVYLNGNKICPNTKEEFTNFEENVNEVIKLTSKDIKIGKSNQIVINAEDNWGAKNEFIYEFMGEYYGLLFIDDKDNYYSTDIGDIIKRLNFKTIIAGRNSEIKHVVIYNNMGVDINNLKITITPEKKPEKLDVFYGFDELNLISDNEPLIKKDIIKDKEKIKLYLMIKPDLEFEYRNGTFEIQAIASSLE